MIENVGTTDRNVRAIVGPLLIVFGGAKLSRDRGSVAGVVAIAAGVGLLASAIARVCPVNRLLNLDTRSPGDTSSSVRTAGKAPPPATAPAGGEFQRMRRDRDEPSRLFEQNDKEWEAKRGT